MLKLKIDGAQASMVVRELLTAGRTGLECEFLFSSDWAGLEKVATFEGCVTKDAALFEDRCTVPAEVLAEAGYQLRIGVYGMDAEGDVVIPTVWAKAGKILPGTYPADQEIALTPSVAAECLQMARTALALARDAVETAQAVQAAADNGDFVGAQGPQGEPGTNGADYVLTDGDKADIAALVYEMMQGEDET